MSDLIFDLAPVPAPVHWRAGALLMDNPSLQWRSAQRLLATLREATLVLPPEAREAHVRLSLPEIAELAPMLVAEWGRATDPADCRDPDATAPTARAAPSPSAETLRP